MLVTHDLAPVFDTNSRVLILGTMPSPKSKASGFYYSHPQNRFWPVLGQVFGEEVPKDKEGRAAFALRHGIALWDVIAQCEITGAQDATIRQATANDLGIILRSAPIKAIFVTGKTAEKWYNKLLLPVTGIQAIPLPSSSPANCAVSTQRIVQAYSQILEFL